MKLYSSYIPLPPPSSVLTITTSFWVQPSLSSVQWLWSIISLWALSAGVSDVLSSASVSSKTESTQGDFYMILNTLCFLIFCPINNYYHSKKLKPAQVMAISSVSQTYNQLKLGPPKGHRDRPRTSIWVKSFLKKLRKPKDFIKTLQIAFQL